MNVRPVQEAKARFSERFKACMADGAQVAARPTLKEWLLSDDARTETLVPPHGKARRRPVRAFQ